jgi:ankyrin repeat protein
LNAPLQLIAAGTPLQLACGGGHTEIVRLLLDLPQERGVDPAADDNTSLIDACGNGQMEIVRLLLDLPLDRGIRQYSTYRSKCQRAKGNCLLLLNLPLERGVNPTAQDNDALRFECRHGHTEIQ